MDSKIAKYADMLFKSASDNAATPPLTALDPSLTVDDAYAIQLYNVNRMLQNGHLISGKKIGLTSPGMQKLLGVNEPDYGHLFQSMEYVDGQIPADLFLQPKIEAEVAFVLKKDLTDENITADDVKDATDYVVGAFEIVDSRVENWKIQLIDTISDNASSGCYVLGTNKLSIDQVNLPDVTMKLYKNGDLVEEGRGAAVLGDPCLSVAWLANRLRHYGVFLRKGEIVLSGAFSAALIAAKGDAFEAHFSHFGVVKAAFI